MPAMRTSPRSRPNHRPVMIMTSPAFPAVGVMASTTGGRPARRELSSTTQTSPITTTVGTKGLECTIRRRVQGCGSASPPAAGGIAARLPYGPVRSAGAVDGRGSSGGRPGGGGANGSSIVILTAALPLRRAR